MTEVPNFSPPSWKIRRRLTIATLVFCAAITVYLTGWGKDDELRATIASGVLFLAGSVLMAYVFGVVWNDTAMFRQPRPADAWAWPSDRDRYGREGGAVTPDDPDDLN